MLKVVFAKKKLNFISRKLCASFAIRLHKYWMYCTFSYTYWSVIFCTDDGDGVEENIWNWSDEVTGEWRRLHNEKLNDLYCSPNIVRVIKWRRMRWDGHVVRMGEEKGVYRVLVGNPEGRRPLGRPRCRWVDNIRMDLQEMGCGYMDCIGLAHDTDSWRTLMSAVMNLRVP